MKIFLFLTFLLPVMSFADSKVLTCYGEVDAKGDYSWLQVRVNSKHHLTDLTIYNGTAKNGPKSGFTFISAADISVKPFGSGESSQRYTPILEDYQGCGMGYHKGYARLLLPEGLKGRQAKVLTWTEGDFQHAETFSFGKCSIF